MNLKRFILAVLAIFFAWSIMDALVHGWLLQPVYEATANLWRPQKELKHLLGYGVTAIYSVCFVLLYNLMGKKSSILSGVQFGALFGFASGLGMGFGSYCYMPIPLNLAYAWFFATLIEATVAGALVWVVMTPGKRAV
jgi:hypothetical protein